MRSSKWLPMAAALLSLVALSPGRANADADRPADADQNAMPQNANGTLTVHVQGLASSDGNLRFVLFDSKKNFLKRPVRADVVEIENQEGAWVVANLPHGIYAVLVHHDVNADGVMERHWYGKPKEPTGTSNDAPSRFGPPKFRDAKFAFDSPSQTITITLR